MTTTTGYKGLTILSPDPSGPGGLVLQNNFKSVADWHPLSVWDESSNPAASNDNSQDYYPGSFWYNTNNSPPRLYLCRDNTTNAAVWDELLVDPTKYALLAGRTGGQTLVGGSSGLTLQAGGTNQNLTFTPSGTGYSQFSGNVGVGTAPTFPLHVASTMTDATSGTKAVLRNAVTVNPSSNSSGVYAGFWNSCATPSGTTNNLTASVLSLVGSFYEAAHNGTGTVQGIVALNANAGQYSGAGAVSEIRGFRARMFTLSTNTVTSVIGLDVNYATGSGGYQAPTNSYALYANASNATNDYGFYLHSTKNYLAGSLGVGVSSPTAALHLRAGTATASTAPLKFTSGTNLTTAEAGAMEYDGRFTLTESDTTRRYIVQAANATKTTGGAPYTNDGYVTVVVNGTTLKLMTTA